MEGEEGKMIGVKQEAPRNLTSIEWWNQSQSLLLFLDFSHKMKKKKKVQNIWTPKLLPRNHKPTRQGTW